MITEVFAPSEAQVAEAEAVVDAYETGVREGRGGVHIDGRFIDAPVAERARRRVEAGHHVSESTLLATHVEALRAAGFAEVGTLWQRGDSRLLCGVLPADLDGQGILSRRPAARAAARSRSAG